MNVISLFQNNKKWLFISGAGILILVAFLYFRYLMKSSGPIGGWEPIKAAVEAKFPNNENLKNAALQLALVHQKAIDYPEDAKTIVVEHDLALSCIWAVMKDQKINDETGEFFGQIEEISTKDLDRLARYIKYNVNLSGDVYPGSEADRTKCNFPLVD